MNLLAQHGFGAGTRIERGLREGLLDGVIFGAKDIAPAKLGELLEQTAASFPESERYFDPQYYAVFIASQPGARLGSLVGTDGHSYFEARRRRDLERESQVVTDLRTVLQSQAALPVTGLIAPNIVIRRSFDSVEATIAKSFLRNAVEAASNVVDGRPLYATLAVSTTALADRIELQNFLQEITEIDQPPDGFYLLVERPDQSIPPGLSEPDVLSRWMLINHTLELNGFKIINGYADALAPYLAAAGADAVGTGWYNTLKTFSLKKFEPVADFARRPVPRYTSTGLLKSIRCTELHDLRDLIPAVLNGLPSDFYYPPDAGSEPEAVDEALQNWDALREMLRRTTEDDLAGSLRACRIALDRAEELYVQIRERGLTMRDRSSGVHIELIREELDAFEALAEI